LLSPWARLRRDNGVIDAGITVVTLQDNIIHRVDAQSAHGVDEYPKRSLQYAADELQVTYNDEGQVDKVIGRNNARLVSVSEGSQTTMTSDRVNMVFESVNGESTLKGVLGAGHAVVESKP